MECPFCGKEMRPGVIPPGQYGVRWISRDNGSSMEVDEVPLTRSHVLWYEDAKAFYCPDCRQVIVPVPEKGETFGDKEDRKMDELYHKVDRFRKDRELRQSEKKEEKKWNKRREKDPWEW